MAQDKPASADPWFENWFDSPYYQLLYRDRDENEARHFIDHLLHYLDLPEEARVLDLACGNGRHAIYLAEKGYQVVGIDLAEEQINEAKAYESERLSFLQHDMRQPFQLGKFDAVFNFFTSFGYFDHENDNFEVISNIAEALNPKGNFVLDYMNVRYMLDNLKPEDRFEINGVLFHVRRYLEDQFVKKDIFVKDGNLEKHFQEKVKAYHLNNLTRMLNKAGLKVKQVFGDYQLNPFVEEASDRVILVSEKEQHA